jgi:hypothetical protein
MLTVFNRYLFDNIVYIGEGSCSLELLGMSVALGAVLFFWRWIASGGIFIKYSAMVLALFYIYFVVRIVLDIGEIACLRSMTIATTGGTFLFYGLGVLIAVSLRRVVYLSAASRKFKRTTCYMACVYMVLSVAFLLNTVITLLPRLRSDIFLIADLQGAYQRPGNFLALSFLLFSLVFILIVLLNKNNRIIAYKVLAPFFILLFFIQTCISIVFSQLIGSNKAFALTAGFALITVASYFLLLFPKVRFFLHRAPLKLKNVILCVMGRRLFGVTAITLALLAVMLWGVVLYLQIDLTSTRIMNFGQGGVASSLSSRIDILLGNFPVQFDYAPFFGNMNVDTLTTGRGSYVHSFLGMSLTHLGLFGTMIFLGYLVMALRSFFIQPERNIPAHIAFVSKGSILYAALMFCAIVCLAVIGTHLTWVVLWFAMGLFTCPVVFRARNEFGKEFNDS